ncbi:hypothetical protein ACJJTC_003925 [Scirpophaga incertulas]
MPKCKKAVREGRARAAKLNEVRIRDKQVNEGPLPKESSNVPPMEISNNELQTHYRHTSQAFAPFLCILRSNIDTPSCTRRSRNDIYDCNTHYRITLDARRKRIKAIDRLPAAGRQIIGQVQEFKRPAPATLSPLVPLSL